MELPQRACVVLLRQTKSTNMKGCSAVLPTAVVAGVQGRESVTSRL
jgi:hypothetical protein